MKFKKGDTCYFIGNGQIVIPATVLSCSGGFCVVKYNRESGIRLRESRLYKNEEEAYKVVPKIEPIQSRAKRTNNYWMH